MLGKHCEGTTTYAANGCQMGVRFELPEVDWPICLNVHQNPSRSFGQRFRIDRWRQVGQNEHDVPDQRPKSLKGSEHPRPQLEDKEMRDTNCRNLCWLPSRDSGEMNLVGTLRRDSNPSQNEGTTRPPSQWPQTVQSTPCVPNIYSPEKDMTPAGAGREDPNSNQSSHSTTPLKQEGTRVSGSLLRIAISGAPDAKRRGESVSWALRRCGT